MSPVSTVPSRPAGGRGLPACLGFALAFSSHYILLLAGTLGPSGNLTYRVKVPELGVGVDSVPFVVQGLLVSPNWQKCQLSSPSSTLLLDRRF